MELIAVCGLGITAFAALLVFLRKPEPVIQPVRINQNRR